MIMAILAIGSARELGLLLAIAAGIYLFFMFLGVGLSSYATFSKCEKTDVSAHFIQGSLWAIYPTVAFLIIRSFEFIRVYFDKFYRGLDSSPAGASRAGWVSVGYVVMLAGIAGMYSLMDSSILKVCVPTVDEAQAFKEKLLKKQAEKAAAQEVTPAVQGKK
jgi:hypothetical protein